VLVTLHIVEDEDGPVAWRKLLEGTFKIHAIHCSRESQVLPSDISRPGCTVFPWPDHLIERKNWKTTPA
jgi:hypothetical protein